jgi:hypothetical protein
MLLLPPPLLNLPPPPPLRCLLDLLEWHTDADAVIALWGTRTSVQQTLT